MKKTASVVVAMVFACSLADAAQKSAAQLRREADRARFLENAKARRDIVSAERSGSGAEGERIRVDGSGSGATLEKYHRVYQGMTYSQAVQILGPPSKEMVSMDMGDLHVVTYKWNGHNEDAAAFFQFDNGLVASKWHIGLE